jgi:hypothetical protein
MKKFPGGHVKIVLICVIVKHSPGLCGQKAEPTEKQYENYRHHKSVAPPFAGGCPEYAKDKWLLWLLLQNDG